ncbi:transglycosylase domain-containing protein, partial [bacterium]|nr:transglycosylase domain-containing protein [bacterium]
HEIIKNKTSFDVSAGKISSFSEISEEKGKFLLKNDMTIHDLTFFHPLIDSQPFKLPLFRFKGEVTFDRNEKSAATKDAELSLGGINAVFSAIYSKDSKNFSIKTESANLNKLETLIHDEEFEGYLFGGTLELLAEYSQEGDEPPVFSIEGNLIDPKQLSERMDYLKLPFEYIWTNEDGSTRKIFVGERNFDFTPISLIPDHLIWAVVVSEDAGFFVHKGVDFQELDAAVKDNIKKHKLRGGSTITQQLAKNLFLNRDKTLLRKFREVLLAIELDATLSKERLLEIYFNIIEWAPGIFGISQASYYYFGKQPYQLTPIESAYLASVIPGPAKYHYMFLSKNVTENWYKSLYRILNIMNETGHLSTDDYFDSIQQPIVFREPEEE